MYFNQTECQIVAMPGDVTEVERVQPKFPEMFTVEVKGSSDHLGQAADIPRLYTAGYGKMYADIREGSDVWLLRHDSVFTSFMDNGNSMPLDNASTSQIHAQTLAQRLQGNGGPQVQLAHGMPSWFPDGCTCALDIVGVPTTQSMKHLQYMGRIRLPELEFLGGEVVLDHWANWFFHFFMDTNKSAPHYGKAPSRISDSTGGPAKTGFSVYGRWEIGDPAIADPTVWHHGLPTENARSCKNMYGQPECDNIFQATFPPRGRLNNLFV